MQKYILAGLSYFLVLSLTAQNAPRPDINLDQFILDLFSVQDEDLNYEEVYETLLQLYRNPLDLNKAQREDLESLFVLSELQINSLLAYRQKYGNLLTIYELQAVPEFDLPTIYKLLPFVEVRDSGINTGSQPLLKRIAQERDNHYLLLRYDQTLETRRGYTQQASPSQKYLGNPMRLYARYRVSHIQDFSLGFTLEKDAGEQLVWQPSTRRYGADFISFHALFQNKGRFKTIALGDYQLQIGQGLLMSAGFTIGKGAETVQTVRRPNLGLRPFTSAIESGYLRGGAITYDLGQFELTAFYSNTRRDGSLSENESDSLNVDNLEDLFIETLRVSGLHRTAGEIAGKGIFREQTWGTHLNFTNREQNLHIGASVVHTDYNLPFRRNARSPRDSLLYLFEFQGKTNHNLGINFNYQWQNFSFFGEAAQSRSGGRGAISGLVASLASQIDFAMVFRHFDRNFHTFFGSALSESTRNINEQGIYWGIKVHAHPKVKLTAYYDRFKFPWLRFRVDAPSEGYEWLGRINYQISKKIGLYAQIRQEVKDRNVSSEQSSTVLREIRAGSKYNYLLNLDYQAEKILRLRSRVQFSSFNFNGRLTQGYALVQDLGLDFGKLSFDARWAVFDTDDFDNRQYIYEKDVLWYFSIPAYSGQGIRNYMLVQYQFSQRLSFWLRWARFTYNNQPTISSGSEQIVGNQRTEVRVQMRVRL
ncbi:MAG: helix-hairpin-helix domain-containing protein [Microscillaceae bacterium]|jgi:hypothetical protein|nr:helix-hairpin-helix domain-containing protein [Microscillaceae bacterium]